MHKEVPTRPFRFLVYVSRPHARWAVVAVVAVFLAQGLTQFIAYTFQRIVDAATAYSSGAGSLDTVVLWATLYPVTVVCVHLSWRLSGFMGMRWVTGARATTHTTLFDYLSRHSATYFANRFSGALTSNITNVVSGVGSMIEITLWQYLPTVLGIVGSAFLVYTASPLVAGIFMGWLVLLIPFNVFFVRRIERTSKAAADGFSKLRGLTVDILSNILAVTHFARRTAESARVAESAHTQRKLALKNWMISEISLTVNGLLIGGFVATITATAFILWRDHLITLGQFVLIFTLITNLIETFVFIGASLSRMAELYGEAKEGLDEILTPYEITDYPKAKALSVTDGTIVYDSVGFSYGTRVVFKNFNLVIKGGERVGIVGPSGAGKTTFVSLLLRQQDVHEGMITIDGQNVRKVTQESVREAIAVVPQEPLLFHRSLRDNIAYGKPTATLEEVEEAARRAEAHIFITELPDGYDTLVGERGVKLSGGQRQRVAIARAIIKNAPILVLDEATSSLDSESEGAIQKALAELMKGKTVIAIAHRLSTIRTMDRIIVMDEGCVTEDGTHDELLRAEGTYARLWHHQAGGFISDYDVR